MIKHTDWWVETGNMYREDYSGDMRPEIVRWSAPYPMTKSQALSAVCLEGCAVERIQPCEEE